MGSLLRTLYRSLSTLILALALGVIVWVSAVSTADPIEDQVYPRTVLVELINQDPSLTITNNSSIQVSLTLRAHKSVWDKLLSNSNAIRAYVDLTKVTAGQISLPVEIENNNEFVRVVSYTPRTISLSLDKEVSRQFPVKLVTRGEPAIGFQAGTAELSQEFVTVSGPETLVNRVKEIRATLDLNQAQVSINRTLSLQAFNTNDVVVSGVKIDPAQIDVLQSITQRGGYRNLVVKVVTRGQIANGYRLTNISAFPATVTVYSNDTELVNSLPGYVDTESLDVSGKNLDIDTQLKLALPMGVSAQPDTVQVQVGIAAIMSSVSFNNMHVEVIGLTPGLTVSISPETVDLILSGPLPSLDRLTVKNIHVVIDLTNDVPGTYQRSPKVTIDLADLQVESISPQSVEITIVEPTPTLTPTLETLSITETGTLNPTQIYLMTLTPNKPTATHMPTQTPTMTSTHAPTPTLTKTPTPTPTPTSTP